MSHLGRQAMSGGQAIGYHVHDSRGISVPNQAQALALTIPSDGIGSSKGNATQQHLNLKINKLNN